MFEALANTLHVATALIGGLFIVPVAAANAIVGNRIEPFFSFIRPGPHISAFEYVLLAVVLACRDGRWIPGNGVTHDGGYRNP